MRRTWEEQRQGGWHEGDNSGTAVPRPISLVGAPGKPGPQGHGGSPPFHTVSFVQLHSLPIFRSSFRISRDVGYKLSEAKGAAQLRRVGGHLTQDTSLCRKQFSAEHSG